MVENITLHIYYRHVEEEKRWWEVASFPFKTTVFSMKKIKDGFLLKAREVLSFLGEQRLLSLVHTKEEFKDDITKWSNVQWYDTKGNLLLPYRLGKSFILKRVKDLPVHELKKEQKGD